MMMLCVTLFVLFTSIGALGQTKNLADCNETSLTAARLISDLNKTPQELKAQLMHDRGVENLVLKLRRCRMDAMAAGDTTLVNLYADNTEELMAIEYDTIRATAVQCVNELKSTLDERRKR